MRPRSNIYVVVVRFDAGYTSAAKSMNHVLPLTIYEAFLLRFVMCGPPWQTRKSWISGNLKWSWWNKTDGAKQWRAITFVSL